MTVIFTTASLLMLLLGGLINATQNAENSYKENTTPFECGFNTMTPDHVPFSFQFFLVAILFLIFDVEISIILSYPLETNTATNTTLIILFLIVILAGLGYEWKNGNLDWSN